MKNTDKAYGKKKVRKYRVNMPDVTDLTKAFEGLDIPMPQPHTIETYEDYE